MSHWKDYTALKFTCRSCGWSIVRPPQRSVECLYGPDLKKRRSVGWCPHCSGGNMSETTPSPLEILDPDLRDAWDSYTLQKSTLDKETRSS